MKIFKSVIIIKAESSLQLTENVPSYLQFRSLGGTDFSVASTACLLQRRMLSGTGNYISNITLRRLSSYIWRCNILRSKNHLFFIGDFLVAINLSSTLVHIRLLRPLVFTFVDVEKHFFLFRVSSRF
jgi:hypothetical protein